MTFGHPISQQLALFLQAAALGASLGLLYDLFRVLRTLGGKLWGGMLDVLFCLIAAFSLFFFVMAGDGEMRVFVILGAAGGMLLFLCLAGPFLRPVWRFWLGVFLFPLRLVKKFLKKSGQKAKKLFSFGRNRATMIFTELCAKSTGGGRKDEQDPADRQ